ncbi:MAG TPA: prepilin peptidase [Candidatus Omnitrophota bacterium]|nr:prepilin peptidase [Candidatus Omnitrophota bacterium]
MMEQMHAAFVFMFGAIVGSFLNVCIHRMPRELSIVWPGSYCPKCKIPIPWYENIPILSYLILGGKCFRCKRPISFRYFFVELLTAVSWLLIWRMYGLSPEFAIAVVFVSAMIVVTLTDLETGLIPDLITIPGMLFGLVVSVVSADAFPEGLWYHKLFASAIGLAGGGAVLMLTGWFGNLVFRKESMGGGDIKLLAMTGAFIGIEKTLLVFMFSPFIALPFAIFYRFVKRQETIPYGPFLALMSVVFFFKGTEILNFLSTLYGV